VNKKVIESLAYAGCFDNLGLKRSQVLYLAQEMLDKLTRRDTKSNVRQRKHLWLKAMQGKRLFPLISPPWRNSRTMIY